MRLIFCTISTKYKLHQCIAMYNSIRHFLPEAKLAVLCMDDDTKLFLGKANLPGIMIIPLDALENLELMSIKAGRRLCEYCWTMKPVLLKYLFKMYKYTKAFVYVDVDICFFENPMKLLSANKRWNVLLSTHIVNKRVNSGFVAVSRNRTSEKVLNWWQERCIEWCFDRNEKWKFGDQGHLNLLRNMFKGIRYLKMPGTNIAPWNYFNYDFSAKEEILYVGRHRLIFFHFSGLRLKRLGESTIVYGADMPCLICNAYCRRLRDAIDYIKSIDSKITEYFYMGI